MVYTPSGDSMENPSLQQGLEPENGITIWYHFGDLPTPGSQHFHKKSNDAISFHQIFNCDEENILRTYSQHSAVRKSASSSSCSHLTIASFNYCPTRNAFPLLGINSSSGCCSSPQMHPLQVPFAPGTLPHHHPTPQYTQLSQHHHPLFLPSAEAPPLLISHSNSHLDPLSTINVDDNNYNKMNSVLARVLYREMQLYERRNQGNEMESCSHEVSKRKPETERNSHAAAECTMTNPIQNSSHHHHYHQHQRTGFAVPADVPTTGNRIKSSGIRSTMVPVRTSHAYPHNMHLSQQQDAAATNNEFPIESFSRRHLAQEVRGSSILQGTGMVPSTLHCHTNTEHIHEASAEARHNISRNYQQSMEMPALRNVSSDYHALFSRSETDSMSHSFNSETEISISSDSYEAANHSSFSSHTDGATTGAHPRRTKSHTAPIAIPKTTGRGSFGPARYSLTPDSLESETASFSSLSSSPASWSSFKYEKRSLHSCSGPIRKRRGLPRLSTLQIPTPEDKEKTVLRELKIARIKARKAKKQAHSKNHRSHTKRAPLK